MVIIATRDFDDSISLPGLDIASIFPSFLSPHNPQNLIKMVKAVVLGAAGKSCFCRFSSLISLGLSGGIGQPLALLLKANPLVTEVNVFIYS
jgi:hypothetical protein